MNVVQPLAIWARRGNFLGNFFIFFERAVFQVNADHRTRTQTSFFDDVPRVGHDVVQDTNLRRNINVIVRSLPESCRSQTVSVQAAANLLTVRENQQCWAIPSFHDTRVVLVEVLRLRNCRFQIRVVSESFRNEQHHRFFWLAASFDQEFRDSVEVCRIRSRRVTQRTEFLLSTFPDSVGHFRFVGSHPVQITLQCVDFTIVTQKSHRLG